MAEQAACSLGQIFVNYLTDVRLKHSVRLLENTALRVQDIAQQAEYPSMLFCLKDALQADAPFKG